MNWFICMCLSLCVTLCPHMYAFGVWDLMVKMGGLDLDLSVFCLILAEIDVSPS